jgi:hypothetical protein
MKGQIRLKYTLDCQIIYILEYRIIEIQTNESTQLYYSHNIRPYEVLHISGLKHVATGVL